MVEPGWIIRRIRVRGMERSSAFAFLGRAHILPCTGQSGAAYARAVRTDSPRPEGGNVTALIVYFVLILTVAFLCSLAESVILSVSHTHIAVLVRNGHRSGRILRRLKRRINHPLTAINTFNAVATTIGAAAVGAQSYRVFGSEWVAFFSILLTVMILIFAEVIPKTLGASRWKLLAPAVGYIVTAFIYLAYPVVIALESVSRLISRKTPQTGVTREEFIVLAQMGYSEKALSGMEARIIENLILLNEIRTEDILTPRSVVIALQKDQTVAEAIETEPPIRFTRIPVYDRDLDDLIGMVLRDRLSEAYYTGRSLMKVESFMGPIFAVPASKAIADLLDEFINRREHLFEVVDEYGGTAGIVTLEDVLETLLGVEIVDEFDSVEDMRAYAVERWKQKRHERGI
jgi:CBS domain containing-hemolysin-like protein